MAVQAPDVSGVEIQASTAAQTPEAPALGTDNDTTKKKKRGKSGLLIQRNNGANNGSGSGGGSYSGLNI